MLQLGARVVDAELPVDPGLFAIALLGPGRRFRRDQSPALDPAIQALAVQRTELQFRNVQPAPVFRGVCTRWMRSFNRLAAAAGNAA